jgi:hypothetical protein
MGDRANVVILDGEAPALFLYTHWGGSELPETLREALDSAAGRGRWSDGPYLARIIFCRMVRGDESAETGFGISTTMRDNEYNLLVVDSSAGIVTERNEGNERNPLGSPIPGRRWTFAEYCAQAKAGWPE